MATIKLSIDARRPYSDGRCPIVFRLSSGTKSTSIVSGVKTLPQDWDNLKSRILKTHPDFSALNLHLKQKLLAFEKQLLGLHSGNLLEIKRVLLNEVEEVTTFHVFATQEIQNLRDQERFGNASVYETSVNRFVKYTGTSISFKEINYNVISGFELTLLKEGICRNTIAIYMREIRALLNLSIKKGLMDRADYPFYNYKIKTEKTISRAITIAELRKIHEHPLKENTLSWHSRNIFFLIFNLIGISFIDLVMLEQDSIQNGRIIYKRRKTGKLYSIKLTTEAERIINIYKNPNSKYLISYFQFDNVPVSKVREQAGLRIKTLNTQLKKIGKTLKLPIPLTSYVSRYTWGNVAKSLGFPKDLIAESYGHQYGNRITGIYLDAYGDEVLDNLNEKVCSSLL
ncbi:MAG: site-specific integrase [Bacteroidota bacterium]